MRKGSDIIGLPVYAYDTGEKLDDKIEDLLFDQYSNQLLGFLVDEKGWFRDAKVLLLRNIHSIGPDAVIVSTAQMIINASEESSIKQVIENDIILTGTRIMTTDGRDLGRMTDLYFDETTGLIEGYEASGGLFADAYSGRSFIPAPKTLKIGEDATFVPAETAEMMEEQVGGVKGAVQSANDKVQKAAQATGTMLQDAAQTAQTNVKAAGRKTNDMIQHVERNLETTVANAVVSPEEQRKFVLEKKVDQTIQLPDGSTLLESGDVVTSKHVDLAQQHDLLAQLYAATGGQIQQRAMEKTQSGLESMGARVKQASVDAKEKLEASSTQAQDAIADQAQAFNHKTQSAVASLAVEEAKGRRARQTVKTSEGFIVAAAGQIVNDRVIAQAKDWHQEQSLLEAVGLSPNAAAQSQAQQAAMAAGDRIQGATHRLGEKMQQGSEQLQTETRDLWEEVKDVASHLKQKGNQALEDRRIKGALGRPATRVILDQSDDVILNTGDLITHAAINQAKKAGVLDILLDSVYSGDPKITREDLRAEHPDETVLESSAR